jgi:esterase
MGSHGMQLNFQQFNEAAGQVPLLMLHGLFGDQSNWRSQARLLSKDHWVITTDLRNHGHSFHDPKMDYFTMASDVQKLLQYLQVLKVDLLGHSMGGKVAMQLAFNQPQLIRSLIVCDIAPVNYSPHHDDILSAMSSINLNQLTSRNQACAIMASKEPDARIRRFLLKSLYRSTNSTFAWRFNLEAIQSSYSKIIQAPVGSAYTGPCLVLKGAKSDYIKTIHKAVFDTLLPAAKLQPMTGCSHWLHAEKPELFCQLIRNFLKSL